MGFVFFFLNASAFFILFISFRDFVFSSVLCNWEISLCKCRSSSFPVAAVWKAAVWRNRVIMHSPAKRQLGCFYFSSLSNPATPGLCRETSEHGGVYSPGSTINLENGWVRIYAFWLYQYYKIAIGSYCTNSHSLRRCAILSPPFVPSCCDQTFICTGGWGT